MVASLNNLAYRTLAAAARSPRNPVALKSVMVFIPSLRFLDNTTFSTELFGLFNDLPVFLVNTTTAATPVPLTLLAVPQVIANDCSLAIPEYLKELTFIRFPGSLENWTAPPRAVLPLFTRKLLLSLIKDQIRLPEADMLMIGGDDFGEDGRVGPDDGNQVTRAIHDSHTSIALVFFGGASAVFPILLHLTGKFPLATTKL